MKRPKTFRTSWRKIQKLGGDANVGAANARAIDITRHVRGINQAQALRIYGDTYGLLGNAHTLEVQELLAKYGVAMGNTLGGDVTKGLSGSRDLVRAAEQMGRLTNKSGNVDIERFQRFIDLAAKIGAATEGQVGAHQLFQMAQQGGPALMNMSDHGLETMAVLSQYMGAQRAGTALMSLNQQFAGGTMWTRNAKELQRLGILGAGEWSKGGGGGIVMTPEARKRLGNQLTDPLQFVVKSLLPAMEAHGITNVDDQIREVYSVFGRATSQREIADIVRNKGQIALELDRLEKGQGLDDQLKTANDRDVTQNIENLKAAWDNFLYSLSQSDAVISVLKALTEGIRGLDKFSRDNPEMIRQLGIGLGVLGAFFVGAGAAAILAAIGPAGWLILGFGALAAEFAVFGKSMFDLKSAVSWITFGPFTPLVTSLYDLGNAIAWLWDKVKALFGLGGAPGSGYNPSNDPYAIPQSYTGPAISGAKLIRASYTTSGGATGTSIASSPMGNFGGVSIAAGVNGNAYISARRAQFSQELQDPNKRLQFAAMLLSEDGKNPIPVAESAMNRSDYSHKTLMQMFAQRFLWTDQSGSTAVLYRKASTRPEADGADERRDQCGARRQQHSPGYDRSGSTQRPQRSLDCGARSQVDRWRNLW